MALAAPKGQPEMGKTGAIGGRSGRAEAFIALRAQAEGRRLAQELAGHGIPALVLKGPELQLRLYGTPAAYRSDDLDILVPGRMAKRARATLIRGGWSFHPGNGVLWRMYGAASYVRDGLVLDLHWGLHAAQLGPASMRVLERALWEGATPGPSGMLEPDAESLLVFLAAHAVGHRFARPEWAENVHRCVPLVGDWDKVQRLARKARLERAVRLALQAEPPSRPQPILDGPWGRLRGLCLWTIHGHFLPRSLRDRIRSALRP